jgi:AraC family transcriptional regulator
MDALCDTLLASLRAELLEVSGARGQPYADRLAQVLAARLIEPRPSSDPADSLASGGLVPWRLRRVTDYMAAHLGEDIALADLTALTGLSRAQFFRAFRQSTGQTPRRYLARLRLAAAPR